MTSSTTRKPRIMVLGYARHGKDTVCEMLRDMYGLSFVSSSEIVGNIAVKPYLAAKGITYPDFETMYADRVNHRKDWFDAIAAWNGDDQARLGKYIFEHHDMYCGMRSKTEFAALKATGILDFTIWVDASKRQPPEDASSNTMSPDMADYVLDNNGTLEQLRDNVKAAYGIAVEYAGLE